MHLLLKWNDSVLLFLHPHTYRQTYNLWNPWTKRRGKRTGDTEKQLTSFSLPREKSHSCTKQLPKAY